jgi:DNA-binding transcriptional regulator/RsmH inhibitor MraZ
MKHAGLKNTVILVGDGERFEMWSAKAWEKRTIQLAVRRNATMDRFGI